MGLSDDPPCQTEACDIQTCLMNKDYQESKCQDVIKKLYVCCSKLAPDQRSTACPKPEMVAKKLRDFGMTKSLQGWE